MDSKHLVIIEQLKEDYRKSSDFGRRKRFSAKFKEKVRELVREGISKKELLAVLPVSIYSIRTWTKDIVVPEDAAFKEIRVMPTVPMHLTVKHTSGFSLEVDDLDLLSILLFKIKSL